MTNDVSERSARSGSTVHDHERVYTVFERCGGATCLPEFEERLTTHLQSVPGVRAATSFEGDTPATAFADEHPWWPVAAANTACSSSTRNGGSAPASYATRARCGTWS